MQVKRLAIAWAALALVAADAPNDLAVRFGAREDVADVSLSPDGSRIAFIAPGAGQGSALYVQSLAEGAKPHRVTGASGDPERLQWCKWAANDRLVCLLYGVVDDPIGKLPFSRMIAIDDDGGNAKLLTARTNSYSRGLLLNGGSVIDWLPDEDGAVLMSRDYLPDDHLGSRLGSAAEGLAVERVDTRTLATRRLEPPRRGAVRYISDGRGAVRIVAQRQVSAAGLETGFTSFSYRPAGKREWARLGDYDAVSDTGFYPLAVDHDRDVAIGLRKIDGRQALRSLTLDGTMKEETLLARTDVDVDELIRIGRRNRVVGASYATDTRVPVYFDADLKTLAGALGRAIPKQPLIRFADSSVDEKRLLIFAGSDDDAGLFYVLDRTTSRLATSLVARSALEGMTLAKVKPIAYRAADGTMVPGYLTLPPGKESARGLPAIVLPHGGPSARDEWGFDWLSQFYAASGYAVLQPNFRGSSGYGDAWFQQNGFRSWKVAIGDVLDAGRWLVSQGIADPNRLAIVGWSYGGYAALQSAVVDPGLFKAVIAIAPVTDLATLKNEARSWSNARLVRDFIGDGPHVREGSPAQNAARIKVPVLLFHGALDANVDIAESRLMAARLKDAGVAHELVTWPKLDHYLEDSAARAQMLSKSDAFLRAAMAM